MGERARVRKKACDGLIDGYHHPTLSLNRWLQFHVSIDWNDWVLRRGPSREKLCLFCARLSPHPFFFLSCWRLELFFLFLSFFSFFPFLSLISSFLFHCSLLMHVFFRVLSCLCFFSFFFPFPSLISPTFSECCFDVVFSWFSTEGLVWKLWLSREALLVFFGRVFCFCVCLLVLVVF